MLARGAAGLRARARAGAAASVVAGVSVCAPVQRAGQRRLAPSMAVLPPAWGCFSVRPRARARQSLGAPLFPLTENADLFCCWDATLSTLLGSRTQPPPPRRPALRLTCPLLPCGAHLTTNGALGGGLRPRAPPLTLSLCFCLCVRHRALRAALGAQPPPQPQLPRVLQSQLGAGQPGGECPSALGAPPPPRPWSAGGAPPPAPQA